MGYSIAMTIQFLDDLNYALGFAETNYSFTGNAYVWSSELAPNSTDNKNCLLNHLQPLRVKSYNTKIRTYQSIIATLPSIITGKSSVINWNPPHLFYLPLHNQTEERIYNFNVQITYPDGSFCNELVKDSTLVLSIE